MLRKRASRGSRRSFGRTARPHKRNFRAVVKRGGYRI